MKIGIFGGTFNPPHNTHVQIVKQAVKQLQLDKLVVMPCGDPPHKSCNVDKSHRYAMAQLAFDGMAQVSNYELTQQGKSFTLDTLQHFKKTYPNSQLYLIIGGDSLRDFGSWHCPQRVAQLATLVVADRARKTSSATLKRIKQDFGAKVQFLSVTPTKTNSTEIRLRYNFGFDCKQLVPDKVNGYVIANGLYSNDYADVIAKVATYLTPKRFLHTFYVVKRGLQLATEQEKDDVFIACLLHDVAKYVPKSKFASYGYSQPNDVPDTVVHSFLGANVARQDFGITNQNVLDAIAYHTVGRPNMSRLEKIVYVADKTEDSRPFAKSHLKKGSLDNMFLACLKEAYQVACANHSDSLCPLSKVTVNYYLGSVD